MNVYDEEGMIPERLLRDLALVPLVDEQQIDSLVQGSVVGIGHDRRVHGVLFRSELRAVLLLSHGLDCSEIAVMCGISAKTVHHQTRAARLVLGAKSNPHLVAIAWRRGLIE